MILNVNGQDFVVDSISALRAHVAMLRQAHWSEVDLYEVDDLGEEGTFFALTMLTHDVRALLVYFRYSGDPGFTSRDPTYSGSKDAMLDFRLSNGQIDEYPAYWTVPIENALRALEYAFVHRARAPWVSWNDETMLNSWQEWQSANSC
jgi:hypothetical protein